MMKPSYERPRSLRRFWKQAAADKMFALVALLACLSVCGCHSPWQVEKQTSPNPFVGAKQFVLRSTTFDNLRVGASQESTYLERKNEHQRQSWQADKEAFAHLFADKLARKVAGEKITFGDNAPFTITPQVTRIEPGSYLNPAEVNMSVFLLDGTGNVLDEVSLTEMVPFDLLVSAASGQRIRKAAELSGTHFGKYLRKRTQK